MTLDPRSLQNPDVHSEREMMGIIKMTAIDRVQRGEMNIKATLIQTHGNALDRLARTATSMSDHPSHTMMRQVGTTENGISRGAREQTIRAEIELPIRIASKGTIMTCIRTGDGNPSIFRI